MLIRLYAANFLSFDSPIEFSMTATKESRHGGRVAEGADLPLRILQTAAIWGPNASGKSNFCRLLIFGQFMVVTGTRPDAGTTRRSFRLRRGASQEPSRLEFDILVKVAGEEKTFRYAFSVTEKIVLEESLTEIRTSSERTYYSRRYNRELGTTDWKMDWWDRKGVTDDDRQFAKFVARGTKDNQLFLHEAMDRNLSLLAPIFRWFRDQLVIVQPDDDYLTLNILEPERAELRSYAGELLRATGSGITGVEAVEVSASALGLTNELKKQVLDGIKDDEGGVIVRSSDGDRFSVFRKGGDLVTSRLVTYRTMDDGTKVQFELSEESDGTRRVFDLSPLFHDLENAASNRVFIIDEFDRSMHGMLSRALLLHYFSSRNAGSRSQVIFTTHDLMLMDQNLLRRDEMWFVDRSSVGSTTLSRLSDRKTLRFDKDVRRAYMEGLFSAIPAIGPFIKRESQLNLPGLDDQE
jgi:AAA15 family ATPase/GTPase